MAVRKMSDIETVMKMNKNLEGKELWPKTELHNHMNHNSAGEQNPNEMMHKKFKSKPLNDVVLPRKG